MSKLSIIIPVYNSEKYLRRCIDSVTKQDPADCQVILIDDGSTDDSFEIMKEEAENRTSRVSRKIFIPNYHTRKNECNN